MEVRRSEQKAGGCDEINKRPFVYIYKTLIVFP